MKQIQVLRLIAAQFNNRNIKWVVGASMMLYCRGLADNPQDIDIIVTLDHFEKADSILRELGQRKPKDDSTDYSTRYFNEYIINSIDIDLMSGFRINLPEMVYEYFFDESSLTEPFNFYGISIPLSPVEDWYLLYQLMNGRDDKVRITENHLISIGIKYRRNLLDAINMDIPVSIKTRIRNILDKY